MGKNLIQQRRGRGTPRYIARSARYQGKAAHVSLSKEKLTGEIVDLVNCPGHFAPLAKVKYDNGEDCLMVAPDGIKVGDKITAGSKENINVGNVMSLRDIPEGTLIFNIDIC